MSSLRAGPWAHRASLVASGLSAFSPRETNPEIWLDAELTTGLSDGDPVGTVPDLSGHGRNFTPNGSAPLWVAGGADGPAFLFDGIDDSLQWYATGLTLTPPFTVLAVARSIQGTDDGQEHTIWDLTSGGNEYALRAFFTYGPGPWFAHYGPVGTGSLVTTIPATDTSWRVWTVEAGELGSVRTQGRFDVAYQPTGYGGKPFNSGAVNVGSRVAAQRPWKGYIRAVLFWNRALSATEKYNLERYYGVKRGITITPHVPTDVTKVRSWYCSDDLLAAGLVDGRTIATWPDRCETDGPMLASSEPLVFWRHGPAGVPIARTGTGQVMQTVAHAGIGLPYGLGLVGAPNGVSLYPPELWENVIWATVAGDQLPNVRLRVNDARWGLQDSPPTNYLDSPFVGTLDAPQYALAYFDNANTWLEVNGLRASAAMTNPHTMTGVGLGPGHFDVADALSYVGQPSDRERLILYDYARRRLLL